MVDAMFDEQKQEAVVARFISSDPVEPTCHNIVTSCTSVAMMLMDVESLVSELWLNATWQHMQ
jgi:hypothetical protein